MYLQKNLEEKHKRMTEVKISWQTGRMEAGGDQDSTVGDQKMTLLSGPPPGAVAVGVVVMGEGGRPPIHHLLLSQCDVAII